MIEQYRPAGNISSVEAFLGTLFKLFIVNMLVLFLHWVSKGMADGAAEESTNKFGSYVEQQAAQPSIGTATIITFAMALGLALATLAGCLAEAELYSRKSAVTIAVLVLVGLLVSFGAVLWLYGVFTSDGGWHWGPVCYASLVVAGSLGIVDGVLTKLSLRAQWE